MTHDDAGSGAIENRDAEPAARKVWPIGAAALNFIAPGLGYLYLGRARLAVAYLLAIFGFIAALGWSGLLLRPAGCYVAIVIALTIQLFAIGHAASLAAATPMLPARSYNRTWIYLIWLVAAYSLGNAWVANRPALFGYESFRIASGSMQLTFQRGDIVMADSRHYDNNDPNYGDIVIYRRPDTGPMVFLSRIVGLPGDSLELRDDVLYRNGNARDEPYVYLYPPEASGRLDFSAITVPADTVWVMSDNRHNATDSRIFGPLSRDTLKGKVVHRWFAYDGGIRWARFPKTFDANDD